MKTQLADPNLLTRQKGKHGGILLSLNLSYVKVVTGSVSRLKKVRTIFLTVTFYLHKTVQAANTISGTLEFCTVYAQEFSGTAARARYADIAEKYHADKVYEPGTIVMLGGEKEITEFGQSSDVPFGVVSTAPAFLMNATEETGADEWLPVALAGRVPVRVVGEVLVGDYLVASRKYPGCAEVGHRSSPEVIGRALGRSSDQGEKLVEAVTRFVL